MSLFRGLASAVLSRLRSTAARQAQATLMAAPGVAAGASSRVAWQQIRMKPDCSVSIGENSIFEGHILFDRPGARVTIGDRTFVGASYLVSAESIEIGADVLIAWGCWLVDHDSHSPDWEARRNDVLDWARGEKDWSHVARKGIVVRDRAWIGFNSTILKGVTIGRGAVVGAGSVVTKDVPDYAVVAGNPARVIRMLEPRG